MERSLRALTITLRNLTPMRALLVIFFSFTIVVSLVLWENRQDFYNRVTNTIVTGPLLDIVLSSESKYKISSMVARRSDLIVSATVASVNVQQNRKMYLYRAFSDRDVELVVKESDARDGASSPVFTSNEQTNKQILSLIRGEFSCSKIIPQGSDSKFGRYLGNKIKYTCRVPIPPSYGSLIGFVVFHLSREPNETELDEIRLESYTISMHIYNDTYNRGATKRI